VTSVFIGGSRRLTRLNDRIRDRLDKVLASDFTILVGDANGTDRAVQAYLAKKKYSNVVVYCVNGKCRNNVGRWQHTAVDPGSIKRDFEYFAAKDAAMARDATYGFMIWDGKSKGTLNNVLNLLSQKKKVLVYLSPAKRFCSVSDVSEVRKLLRDPQSARIRDLLRRFHVAGWGTSEPTLDLVHDPGPSSS